jgi:tRNA(Ile)-lysidine synthase
VIPRLTQQVADAFLPHPPAALGVAVSGGGDSMALLHLMHGFCSLHGTRLRAVTVDHGLRAGSAAEAEMVRRFCAGYGIPHDTLLWDDWDGRGNLQDAARQARYQRMAQWGDKHGIDTIALGHTADDQAETFLMRLARQSGVDGLSAMAPRKARAGITWVRPLLRAGREELRGYLRSRGIGWAEDPSNEDPAYTRIVARNVLAALAPLGIDATGLATVAENMSQARKALDWQSFIAARQVAQVDAGAVVLDERGLRLLPDEIQRRLLVSAVAWISGAAYPPRRAAINNLMSALRRGQAGTVEGCHARRVQGHIWVFRELNAVEGLSADPGSLWDRRWRLTPADPGQGPGNGVTVRALGPDGIEQVPDWRASGRPHAVLLSTPAVWHGDRVLAAPLAARDHRWHAQVDGGDDAFFAALLSH